jgi:hypothetical protein
VLNVDGRSLYLRNGEWIEDPERNAEAEKLVQSWLDNAKEETS